MIQTVREAPRISVNKLGDYMVAPPGRRRSILMQQKVPPTFLVTYYDDAYQVLREFYELGGEDEAILARGIEKLEARIPESDFEEQRTQSCVEALSCFYDLTDTLDFNSYEVRPADRDQDKLILCGVQVSVRPELILARDGEVQGAVKFSLSKGSPLSREVADYIGTTLHQYVQEILGASDPRPRDTFVIDVFSRRLARAPRSFVRRRRDIEAACEEIAVRWPTL